MAEVEYVAHVIVMPIVLSIGMVNQCLNICTLASLPASGFLFLKASAIADILSIVACIPFILRHAHLHDPHCYSCIFYHAHFELPLANSLMTSSALCIVAMTVDRYLSVCHPITFFKASDSRIRSVVTVLMLYGIAFVVYLPSVWQKDAVPREIESTLSGVNITIWEVKPSPESKTNIFKTYLFVRELITRVGPVVVLVLLNAAMIRSLRQLNHNDFRRSQRRRSNARGGREADRTRISVLLLITSTTFIICNIPATLLSLTINRDGNRKTVLWETFRAIANLLQVTSYLYNFYLYALCSSEYRNAFLRLFGCREGRSAPSTGDSPTVKYSTTAIPTARKRSTMKAPLVTAEFVEAEEMTALQRPPEENNNITTSHI